MAQPFEVEDFRAQQFAEAIWENDSSAAAHMLKDVGSCGWKSLINKSNDVKTGMREPLNLGSHVELVDGADDQSREKITVYNKRYKSGNANIATVTDSSCKDK